MLRTSKMGFVLIFFIRQWLLGREDTGQVDNSSYLATMWEGWGVIWYPPGYVMGQVKYCGISCLFKFVLVWYSCLDFLCKLLENVDVHEGEFHMKFVQVILLLSWYKHCFRSIIDICHTISLPFSVNHPCKNRSWMCDKNVAQWRSAIMKKVILLTQVLIGLY